MMDRLVVVVAAVLLGSSAATAQVPAGGEFRANTYTTGDQADPSVASDAYANFVVVWQSAGQDGSSRGIFARRYDATGAPRGPEFQVNTYTAGSQERPSVASDVRGRFVVVWQSTGQDGSEGGIFGQRYDAAGVRSGTEFMVNSTTTLDQYSPSVASDATGNFVVTWTSDVQNGSLRGVFAQRFAASGAPRGTEFQVNTHTTAWQDSVVAANPAGNFVVAWSSDDGNSLGVFARRFDTAGTPVGPEFQVNTYTRQVQYFPTVALDDSGAFVIVWQDMQYVPWPIPAFNNKIVGQRYSALGAPQGSEFQVDSLGFGTYPHLPSVTFDSAASFLVTWGSLHHEGFGNGRGVLARRYESTGAPRGSQFPVNTYVPNQQTRPAVASDRAGNPVVAWESCAGPGPGQDGDLCGVFAQRFGGIVPVALDVDASATGGSDGNRVLEPGESVDVRPSWRNVNGAAQTFDGNVLAFTGPPASGVSYQLLDGAGTYGTVPNGAAAQCTDCYRAGVAFGGVRPAVHWDATLTERLTPDILGQTMPWALHIGDSFSDVPRTSPFYRFVETLLHRGVSTGCASGVYCASAATTREQMAAFVLLAKEGGGYAPVRCSPPNLYADVPETSIFCDVIEELARRGVVAGCGPASYCPQAAVSREQMAVFVLRTLDPALTPPACTTPIFADVPASSPFCPWIEELARRGVVSGCGGGNYCPTAPVTREQMAVFLTGTFGLTLYGP